MDKSISYMNPNSKNQLWSRWSIQIQMPFSPRHGSPIFEDEVKTACAKFLRQEFGSASELKFTAAASLRTTTLKLVLRTEGIAAHDPGLRKSKMDRIANFFGENLRQYGEVKVTVDVFIEAGDVQDGKPPAQVIVGDFVIPTSTAF